MPEDRRAVLIVGAGAAGLAASALLARQGVTSLLVEKRREIFVYPKARNLTFRTLEILRALGVGDEVNAVAEHISTMVAKTTLSSGDETEMYDTDFFPSSEGLSPEPFGKYCPQSRLEPILLAETRRRGSEVRYGVELESFTQDETAVRATLKDIATGAVCQVRADYLLAADGTHSPARKQLGITTSGYGQLPMFVVFIYFRAPWRRFVPGLSDGDAIRIENPDVTGIFIVAQGDLGVLMTTYFPSRGETVDQFTPQRCREMVLKAVGAPIDVEIVDVAPWQPYEQVADEFRSGRVFLVGDSAHTMPPFKGGGANTAIQSAHNLAWKIAAVLNGTAGPALLDTYHSERHPVARFAARQSLTGPGVEWLPLGDDRPRLSAGEERPMFYMIAGYKYRSAAVVTDEPAPGEPDAVHLVDGEQLHGEPGTRMPHAWLERDGLRISSLDLLSAGFTLFTGAGGAPWVSAAASVSADPWVGAAPSDSTAGTASGSVQLLVCRIGEGGDVRDVDGSWAQLTGLPSDGALMVRPDGFVGWRGDRLPASPESELRRVLCRILQRPPG